MSSCRHRIYSTLSISTVLTSCKLFIVLWPIRQREVTYRRHIYPDLLHSEGRGHLTKPVLSLFLLLTEVIGKAWRDRLIMQLEKSFSTLKKILYTTTVFTIIYPSSPVSFSIFLFYLNCPPLSFPLPIHPSGEGAQALPVHSGVLKMDHLNKSVLFKLKKKKKNTVWILIFCLEAIDLFCFLSDVLTWQFICLFVCKKN